MVRTETPKQGQQADDLERLRERGDRLRLVARIRFLVVVLLFLFAVLSWRLAEPVEPVASMARLSIALAALVLGVGHSALVWVAASRLSLKTIQGLSLGIVDIVVVTLLVFASGGHVSWLWPAYLLVPSAAAHVSGSPGPAWGFAGLCGLAHGVVLLGQATGLALPPGVSGARASFLASGLVWCSQVVLVLASTWLATRIASEHRMKESRLRYLSIRDGLTGLYNRRYFFHRLNGELIRGLRYSSTLSLILIDLDDFKRFNDAYGHLEGDWLLRRVAGVISRSVRRSDAVPSYDLDVAARYGGEEFVILLPATTVADAMAVAERLRREVERDLASGIAERREQGDLVAPEGPRRLTISQGIATAPADAETGEDLFRAADRALYRAKSEGKNRVAQAGARITSG